MISSIRVAGYRCFEQFEMSGLGRVNLLVGTNGSGKTSMLEALYLLSAGSAPAQFIAAESLSGSELLALWDDVASTLNEKVALGALRLVDPDIERIACQASQRLRAGSRGGFVVKSRRFASPVPIGSMGDGMWRMLALAIAVTRCAGGTLLVDEIDTGLHYTVIPDMWRLVFGAARDLDVQVFATTHSLDCMRSLAQVCVRDDDAINQVSLQRIERGRSKSIPYSEAEIKQAAEHNIEVR